jgi:hypothetical protein
MECPTKLSQKSSEWLAHTPSEVVIAHTMLHKKTYDAVPKNGGVLVPLSELALSDSAPNEGPVDTC